MQNFPFEKALFLENDAGIVGGQMLRLYRRLEQQEGIDCQLIGNANWNIEDVRKALADCDVVIFQSTFIYPDQIRPIGKLFKHCNPKTILIYAIGNDLRYDLEKTWSDKELMEFDKHTICEIKHLYIEDDLDNWYVPFDMTPYRHKIEYEKELARIKNANRMRTGRKVRIRKILSLPGPEWSLLKEGDICDELDCSDDDPRPGRGVWVKGKTEPVKLVNDNDYDEWEYDDPNAYDLAKEICSMAGGKVDPEIQKGIGDFIHNNSSPNRSTEGEIHSFCTDTCDVLRIPRRGYRQRIFEKIKAYGEKHRYFKKTR